MIDNSLHKNIEDDLCFKALVHVVPNPVHEVADLSVDARVASPSTTNAPTHDSQQLLDQFSYKRYERFLFQSKHFVII